MDHSILGSKKGQGILESAMVLILGILLLGGVLHIWVWGNSQLVGRQAGYQASRLGAGQGSGGNGMVSWGYAPSSLGNSAIIGLPSSKRGGTK